MRMARIFRIFCFVVLASICGCANIMERSEGTYTMNGMERGSPYFCAPHPYYCTEAAAKDCLAAPYRLLADDCADWGVALWSTFATLTYPFWIVDEVCEIVFDTVFLPCDIYALYRDKPSLLQDEVEKAQEAR